MRRLFIFWRQGGRDLRLLWRALKHPDRPAWLVPATVLLAFFALDPANLALPLLAPSTTWCCCRSRCARC